MVKDMGLCRDCAAFQLGACRRLDYCRQEREPLMEEARQLAQARGHDLGEFAIRQDGHSIFEARCMQCGRTVSIDVNPGPGERDVSGDAVIMDCQQHQDETVADT